MISACWASWRDCVSNIWGTRRKRSTTSPSCSASKQQPKEPDLRTVFTSHNPVAGLVTHDVFCCNSQWNADQVRPLPGSQCSAGARAAVSGTRQARWSYQTLRNSKVSFSKTTKAFKLFNYVHIQYASNIQHLMQLRHHRCSIITQVWVCCGFYGRQIQCFAIFSGKITKTTQWNRGHIFAFRLLCIKPGAAARMAPTFHPARSGKRQERLLDFSGSAAR